MAESVSLAGTPHPPMAAAARMVAVSGMGNRVSVGGGTFPPQTPEQWEAWRLYRLEDLKSRLKAIIVEENDPKSAFLWSIVASIILGTIAIRVLGVFHGILLGTFVAVVGWTFPIRVALARIRRRAARCRRCIGSLEAVDTNAHHADVVWRDIETFVGREENRE